MGKIISKKAKNILALLTGGETLKFRCSPQGYFRIMAANKELWSGFHRRTLLYAINILFKQGLVDIAEGLDGITTIAITDAGKQAARDLVNRPSIVNPEGWDRKWRLVLFDVPETKKKSREALRYHLRKMGFTEFRRSAFIFPHPCTAELSALADQLDLRDHVALVTAESISDEFKFKKHFGLL